MAQDTNYTKNMQYIWRTCRTLKHGSTMVLIRKTNVPVPSQMVIQRAKFLIRNWKKLKNVSLIMAGSKKSRQDEWARLKNLKI